MTTRSPRTRSVLIATLWLSLFTGGLGGVPSCWARPLSFPDYDRPIKRAVKQYWADFPFWMAWKSQLYQESKLDPFARSGAGAVGLAQFMPGTWDDTLRQIGLRGDRTSAELSIQAGAYYMARLRQAWKRTRTDDERHDLALASYNAGLGHILSAQRRCGDALVWADIAPCLDTGESNARQTRDYVTNIHRWWALMEAGN